jgi:hypothetical protein
MTQEAPATRGIAIEHLDCRLDLTYNWGYAETRADLRALYAKAKLNQWNGEETLPWATDVDPERPWFPDDVFPLHGSAICERLAAGERRRLTSELMFWRLSQFLHGEQGALLAAVQLVATVPDIESKYFAASQVMDEARHVEVFDRYLHQKLGTTYPISAPLKTLLDLILTDSRWDVKLLGMQIIVEGLALAAFAAIRQITDEPLLRRLLEYVLADEARHVAYGVLSLSGFYSEMKEAERREREDFVYEACVLMRDRFLYTEVWQKAGLPVAECEQIARESTYQQMLRRRLFARIVPAVRRIGLLSDRQRERFAALGILEFENEPDPA